MLSPDHHITTQSIYIGSDYFGSFRKREAVKEQIAESTGQEDLKKDQINQEAGKVSRSKDHSAKIDQHQERIELGKPRYHDRRKSSATHRFGGHRKPL